MNNLLTIGEIAQLLEISAPTLRFWEEKGLFTVAKSQNKYRKYTLQDVIQIADIISCRNLGIPIRDVALMQNCSIAEYDAQLSDRKQELQRKIASYQEMLSRVFEQEKQLAEVKRLSEHEFESEPLPFAAVAAFDYSEKDKLLQYIKNSSMYVRYFDTRDLSTETRAIIVNPQESTQPLLWKKQDDRPYLTFLIKEKVDQDYLSNLSEKLEFVRERYQTGILLAQYLLTANEDGERIDFLKAYLETKPL